MLHIKQEHILSDVVQEHISLIPILSRFGIRLGLKELTIQEICEAKGLDTDFLLHILNSYLDPDFKGALSLTPERALLLADYMERSNAFYRFAQLPNIEVHLHSFVKRSSQGNPAIQTVPHVLTELKRSLTARVEADEKELLPHFRELASDLGRRITGLSDSVLVVDGSQLDVEAEDRSEALLSDVMQVLVRHISGDFDDNLIYGLLYSLNALKIDLESNNRLRQSTLLPILHLMEQAESQSREE
ncbi:MAG: hypothetical protein Q4D93_00805 [Porphyromonas sp.]|nr:hypothetical protein [Porphyromonas sp.]